MTTTTTRTRRKNKRKFTKLIVYVNLLVFISRFIINNNESMRKRKGKKKRNLETHSFTYKFKNDNRLASKVHENQISQVNIKRKESVIILQKINKCINKYVGHFYRFHFITFFFKHKHFSFINCKAKF